MFLPVVGVVASMICGRPSAVDLEVCSPFLCDVAQNSLTHWRATYISQTDNEDRRRHGGLGRSSTAAGSRTVSSIIRSLTLDRSTRLQLDLSLLPPPSPRCTFIFDAYTHKSATTTMPSPPIQNFPDNNHLAADTATASRSGLCSQ